MVDFSLSRLKHQARKLRLRLFLDGKSEVIPSDEDASPRNCKLGQWVHSVGLKEFENIPEVLRLEKVHAEVHAGIRRIIDLKRAGHTAQAEQEFIALEPFSDELLSLLTTVEQKVIQGSAAKTAEGQ